MIRQDGMLRVTAMAVVAAFGVLTPLVPDSPKAAKPEEAGRRATKKLVPAPAPISKQTRSDRSPLSAAARKRLAAELARLKTQHPRKLVDVIAELADRQPLSFPPEFLLSIAFTETHGRVLAVSPAGAAGLAQATPAAYLSEHLDGKLFVTNQYLIGTRAYIMKKPLGDAMSISEALLKKNTRATRLRARTLIAAAMRLRREGTNELAALRPVANDYFYAQIARADAHNRATLSELNKLIVRGAPRAALKRFHARVDREYHQLMRLQRSGWSRYAKQLTSRRDAVLRQHFGGDPALVIRTRPYEAGEYLGRALDARFSPTGMAEFLSAHLGTKEAEARRLGLPQSKHVSWTAALYNGGAVNITRMRAGLLGRLTETQSYMRRVPRLAQRLEDAMS